VSGDPANYNGLGRSSLWRLILLPLSAKNAEWKAGLTHKAEAAICHLTTAYRSVRCRRMRSLSTIPCLTNRNIGYWLTSETDTGQRDECS